MISSLKTALTVISHDSFLFSPSIVAPMFH